MPLSEDQHANHRYYCDFILKSLTETANAVTKAAAFYLAIMAALTGYIISQRLSPALRDLTFYVEAAVSVFAVITGLAVGIGLHRGLNTYRKALRALDPPLYDTLRIEGFCRRGLRTLWITIGCFFLMIAIFIFGLTRIRLLLHDAPTPNQAMERTPNGARRVRCDIDRRPAGGLAGKPGIKAFGVAHLVSR